MRNVRLGRPSRAMVVSFVALVVALGGTGYAAFKLPKNSVGTNQLKNGAVTSNKLRNGAVGGSKLSLAGLTVPNASHASTADSATQAANSGQLGGIASSGFMQGQGKAGFGIADAPISPAATDCGTTVTATKIIDVPEFGFIDGHCDNYNAGTPICAFSFHDTAGVTFTGTDVSVAGGTGGTPLSSMRGVSVNDGATIDDATNLPDQQVTWQIGLAGAAPRLLTAIVTQSHPTTSPTSCHFQAQTLVQGG